MTPFQDLPRSLVTELAETGLDARDVYELVRRALDEDLPEQSPYGPIDVTSAATISADARAVAEFGAREPGVIAGLGVAALVFYTVLGEDVVISDRLPDGAAVVPGDVVMRVAGPTRGLLTAERTALNLACHLSGIATATAAYVQALAGTPTKVLDTRKTLPGLRALQKYAVVCGGGVNHRLALNDLAMVKDNHVIAAGSAVAAYEAVRAAFPDIRVEVEVTDLDQLQQLIDAGCELILLDNMDTPTMAEAVRISAGRAKLEASGRLTLERAREVGETGVDFMSVGALTHSVQVFDLGMDLADEATDGPGA